MAEAIPKLRWNHLSSASPSIYRLSPSHLHHSHRRRHSSPTATLSRRINCKAVEIETSVPVAAETRIKKSRFEIENLTTWLLKQEQAGYIDAELAIVLSSISLACKQIASLIQRSSIINLTGAQGTINIQGEDQKKLDVFSNELFCNCLRSSGRTGIIASEEEDVPVAVEETYSGNYILVFDRIDGSANIDTSLTTGSLFGIYGQLDQENEKCIISVCQPGSNLLAAGCLYSSSMVLTLSIGRGVHAFTLDPTYGEFVLTHEVRVESTPSMKVTMICLMRSCTSTWMTGKPYSGRYIGCLVGEIHRMLLVGGIYGNPNNKNSKNGNLRLLFECAPMSYLVEQAGGKATDGKQRILEIKPEQHTPIFIESPDEIVKLEKNLSEKLTFNKIQRKHFISLVFLNIVFLYILVKILVE